MNDVTEGVIAYIRWTQRHPLPPDAPTLAVLADLRGRLGTAAPGWRGRAVGDRPGSAVEVEIHLRDGRAVRGILAQQPSGVVGEAA